MRNGHTVTSKNTNAAHDCDMSIFRIDVYLFNAVVVFYFLNAKPKCRKLLSLNKKKMCIRDSPWVL